MLVLSDAEAEEIRAGLAKGVRGPAVLTWVRRLLQERDERKRSGPSSNGGRPRWEIVVVGVAGKREPQELTQRLRVPGGWLYRTIIRGVGEGQPYAVSMCFVAEYR